MRKTKNRKENPRAVNTLHIPPLREPIASPGTSCRYRLDTRHTTREYRHSTYSMLRPRTRHMFCVLY